MSSLPVKWKSFWWSTIRLSCLLWALLNKCWVKLDLQLHFGRKKVFLRILSSQHSCPPPIQIAPTHLLSVWQLPHDVWNMTWCERTPAIQSNSYHFPLNRLGPSLRRFRELLEAEGKEKAACWFQLVAHLSLFLDIAPNFGAALR